MLAVSIQLTLALEILLVCGEGAIPQLRRVLPLGRSHLAQLGLLLGLAVCCVEIADALAHLMSMVTASVKATRA
jgi:hypothetical protein